MKKLYIIAGEDSGDLHASNLVHALRQQQPQLQLRGIGGDKLAAEGMELIAHIKDINFMGFWEVISNLRTIRKLFKTVKADLRRWQPDAVVLVDYPGFNLRMAKFLKRLNIKVIYYISPQLWAWKKGRIKTIRACVDRMLVILPFEQDFYAKEGVEVDFVGHPLLDEISKRDFPPAPSEKPLIALLPGSRKQEIARMLPVMLSVVPRFPEFQFVVAGAPSQPPSLYEALIGETDAKLRMNRTYELLSQADYAVVTSGTATLETALFRVPEVVCYKGGRISYQIGKRLIRVPFISLVNLILQRRAVEELIQHRYTPDEVERALRALISKAGAQRLAEDYAELRQRLGQAGASERAAAIVAEELQSPSPQPKA